MGSSRRARHSVRLRAALGLGLLGGFVGIGSYAYWTDDVTISGTAFLAGTLDLQVNSSDSYTTTTLGMSGTPMVPGNTSAEVLTVKNNGNVPLKYTVVGGLGGADAGTYSSGAVLKLTVVAGGTRSGSGNSASCTGGTTIYGPTALTNVTSTAIIGTRRGPIAAAGVEALCFQITFDASAANSFQGKTATATFVATGTSDVS